MAIVDSKYPSTSTEDYEAPHYFNCSGKMNKNRIKVAILTQPLGHNYGGLLQAYALQVYLKNIGCEVETLDRQKKINITTRLRMYVVNLIKLVIGRIKSMPTERRRKQILSELLAFREKKLSMSPPLYTERALRKYCRRKSFNVYIVGSDQVWRPRYSPSILNFYLDFLDQINSKARRLSYSASFGVDDWEYTSELTSRCKELIRRFDALSVRENSAQELCKKNFGVAAEWVVDPTLLLEKEDYDSLIIGNAKEMDSDFILSYVLDQSIEKQSIISNIEKILEDKVFHINPVLSLEKDGVDEIEKYRQESVENWLKAFKFAKYVVTDSFHGTVFSILYNKPFVSICNPKRGAARFESLLAKFGLQNRMVRNVDEVTPGLLREVINWDEINRRRLEQGDFGRQFLKKNMGNID